MGKRGPKPKPGKVTHEDRAAKTLARLGRDDSPGAGVEWLYAWERSTVYEIRIEIMGGEA